MEELPPAQRAAIVQRYYLGMSETEMAESAGSPKGTVKKRLHSARGRLAKLLGPRARMEANVEADTRTVASLEPPAWAGHEEGGIDRG